MKRHIYHFNLIEVVLAVAVIGFGVVVILGMLPKGIRATQTAGIESYSSEIIDQMGNYLQQEGADGITTWEEDWTKDEFWNANDIDSLSQNYAQLLQWMDSDYTQAYDGPADYERTNMLGVFHRKSTGNMGTIYVVVMGNTFKDDDAVETKTDFTGLIRVWKKRRKYQQLAIKHNKSGNHNCVNAKCGKSTYVSNGSAEPYESGTTEADTGATVCMELSYPLSLPYAERTKRYYSFDVEEQE